jgi:hypothetical protein
VKLAGVEVTVAASPRGREGVSFVVETIVADDKGNEARVRTSSRTRVEEDKLSSCS